MLKKISSVCSRVASPMTIGRMKFEEAGLSPSTIQIIEPRPQAVTAGPFTVQFVPVSHSIPESAALVIDTPAGRVVHSGDFKLDHTPVVGEGWDDARFLEIAAERPVKALMCDSTNVFSLHAGRSEASIKEPIRELVSKASGMVVATTFASNVARLKTLAEAARVLARGGRLMVTATNKDSLPLRALRRPIAAVVVAIVGKPVRARLLDTPADALAATAAAILSPMPADCRPALLRRAPATSPPRPRKAALRALAASSAGELG